MIVNKRVTEYINSLNPGEDLLCESIAKDAKASFVPIIKRETSCLLKTLVAAKQPRAILEVGTAVGYSALLMSHCMPKGCSITTIENYEKRIPIAKENFRLAGKEDVITLLEGDAEEVLTTLAGPYDFIFMDAAKGQYIHWLPLIMKLLPIGGVLLSDNVLQDGDIIESHYGVERRNRTIHGRMREYLYTLKHMEELETAIVPIGDGITISTRVK